MKLHDFAQEHLNVTSLSTNPTHKRLVALQRLDRVSALLTDEQYNLCKQFILNDFDESFLLTNNSVISESDECWIAIDWDTHDKRS